MPTNQRQLSLEQFVFWLIQAQPDDKFFYRRNICEAVQKFGKENVLSELERQSQSFHNVGEAVNVTRLVRDIK